MKRSKKLGFGILSLAFVALFASGCTANFCTNKEKSKIAYAFEPGVSEYVLDGTDYNTDSIIYSEKLFDDAPITLVVRGTLNDDTSVKEYKLLNKSKNSVVSASQLNGVISSAKSSAISTPNLKYFVEFDKKVLNRVVSAYNAEHADNVIDLKDPNLNISVLDSALKDYGYVKFYGGNDTFGSYRAINSELRNELGYVECASIDFQNYYISTMSSLVEQYRSSITVYSQFEYGNYNGQQIKLEGVTWKQAWGKGGHLIEGLIVYPVAWLIDTFAFMFAGGKGASVEAVQAQYLTGVPQILSILVVTVIVRLFIFLCTFRSTLAQKKMSELQPELAKIQQKYPNSNTDRNQKQRLAEEQMRLYKKHKVNPLSQLLVLIIQFPVFIGVWGAMTGSAVLSTGTFLDLDLSSSIWQTLKIGPKAHPGWWTALVLILLMSVAQFFAMKVPQWIQKAKAKNVAKLGKNPAQKQQNRTANIVSYVMLIMIIVMGFTLPAAMGVYWFVGAIVSLIQTVFTSVIFAGNKKKK